MYKITRAQPNDTPAIVRLLNMAYRGEASRAGWTTEAEIIRGTVRTDEATVGALLRKQGSWFFKCVDENEELAGCVNLQQEGTKMYLGMLSVQPLLQGRGIGKSLLQNAEKWARRQACTAIYMQVISERTELNDWYKRHGYRLTGESKPFDVPPEYGVPVKPLTFIYLEKTLS